MKPNCCRNGVWLALVGFLFLTSYSHSATDDSTPTENFPSLQIRMARAEAGDKKAQLDLGAEYMKGEDVPKDYAEALKWFQKAADQGYERAYYNLGVMYYHGYGVGLNAITAFDWFLKSAEAGFNKGQLMVANWYENGIAVQRNYGEAKKWYTKAAANGSSEAQQDLKGFTWRYFKQSFEIKKIEMGYGSSSSMFLMTLLLYAAPLLAVGLLIIFLIAIVTSKGRRNRRWSSPWVGGLLFAVGGMALGYIWSAGWAANSIHGVGFYYLGVFSLVWGGIGYVLGWSILALLHFYKRPPTTVSVSNQPASGKPSRLYLIVPIILLLGLLGWYVEGRYAGQLIKKIWAKETSPDELTVIAKGLFGQYDGSVANELARNRQSPPEALKALRKSRHWKDVRWMIGSNPNASAEILTDLGNDPDDNVRRWLAQNPHLPVDVARKLASDKIVEVRVALARNKEVPRDLLMQLENDSSEYVRSTSSYTLTALANPPPALSPTGPLPESFANEIPKPSHEPVALLPVKDGGKNGKYGYIDRSGKIVIKPQFDSASAFQEDRASVGMETKEGIKYGFIDPSGSLVIKAAFMYRGFFQNGLASMTVRTSQGVQRVWIDKWGRVVKAPTYQDAGPFSEGLAKIRVQDKIGYIDTSGKIVIDPQFTSASNFMDGLAYAMSAKFANPLWSRFGFIDKAGKFVIKAEYAQARDFSDGLAAVSDTKGQWGFIDKTGKMVIEPQFKSTYGFHDGLAPVQVGYQWGFIDKSGKMVIPAKYFLVNVGGFSEGLVCVCVTAEKGIKWGFIDQTGKWVIEPQFSEPSAFKDGLAEVILGRPRGCIDQYIDKTGKVIWKAVIDY